MGVACTVLPYTTPSPEGGEIVGVAFLDILPESAPVFPPAGNLLCVQAIAPLAMPDEPRNVTGQTKSGANRAPIDLPAALAEHDAWLRTVVLARLGEPDAVGDVMQQTALAAAKGVDRLRDPAKLAPWLYRIAVTQTLLHRRQQGRRRRHHDHHRQQATIAEHDASQPDPLDWLLADEQRQLVRRALHTLPGRDAEILLLKYSQDWSYRQIAQHIGVGEAALEGRLHRARRKLRKALVSADPTLVESHH